MINPPPPPKAPTPHKVMYEFNFTLYFASDGEKFSNPGRAEGYEPHGQFDTAS